MITSLVCVENGFAWSRRLGIKGRGGGWFPPEMARFRVVSFDKEIVKFVKQGGSKENMGLRFMELGCEVKGLGPGDVRFGEIDI